MLASGQPGKDKTGKPSVKKLSECEALTSPSDVDKCKGLFLDVTACRKKNDTACEQQAIAAWAVENIEIITVDQVPLVAKDGTAVNGSDGKPIVKKLADCASIQASSDRDTCRELFKAVSDCRNSPPAGTAPADCEHAAIASWITTNPDQSGVPISVTEVPLFDADGNPVKKGGKQIVMKLADCDHPTGDLDKDTCRQLFVDASNCKIDWGDEASPADCQKAKAGEWVSQNMASP